MAELPLPAPDTTSDFGIDSAVNMSTIDEWLGRDDVVYRDLRMLVDPADFKAVGGDPLLSRAIAGFKVVPFPFLATLPLLPIEGIYQGDALSLPKMMLKQLYLSMDLKINPLLQHLLR